MICITIIRPDCASIVVPTRETPSIVLKHAHGEPIRTQPSGDGTATVDRCEEHTVTWLHGEQYGSLEQTVNVAVDMQAFGFRRGGEPSGMIESNLTGPLPGAVLEIEPLDRGGIVVDDREAHLPIVFHMISGEYWRISTATANPLSEYQLEYRADDVDSWETVDSHESNISLVSVLPEFLDEIEIPYVSPAESERIRAELKAHETSFANEVPEGHKDLAERIDDQSLTLDFDSDER